MFDDELEDFLDDNKEEDERDDIIKEESPEKPVEE